MPKGVTKVVARLERESLTSLYYSGYRRDILVTREWGEGCSCTSALAVASYKLKEGVDTLNGRMSTLFGQAVRGRGGRRWGGEGRW